MKILFLKDKRSESGIEGVSNYLFCICQFLEEKKIDYLVLYNSKDLFYKMMLEKKFKIKYLGFKVNSPKNIFLIKRFKKIIDRLIYKRKFNIISVQFPGLLNLITKKKNIKIFCHQHGAFKKNYKLKLINTLNIKKLILNIYNKFFIFNFSKADKIISVSNASLISSIKTYNIPKKKIVINRYGLIVKNPDHFQNIRREFNIKDNQKIILSVARETKDKGVEDFCKIAKKINNPEYKFLFLGGYRDKNYHEYLLEHYSDYVKFVGMRSDVSRFYKSSDLFLFLSHRESAGQVLMESLNFSLPIITWKIFGVDEIVINEKNGFLCKFGDFLDLEKKIKLLLNDKNLYQELVKNSFIEFKQKYNIQKSGENLINIFKNS